MPGVIRVTGRRTVMTVLGHQPGLIRNLSGTIRVIGSPDGRQQGSGIRLSKILGYVLWALLPLLDLNLIVVNLVLRHHSDTELLS